MRTKKKKAKRIEERSVTWTCAVLVGFRDCRTPSVWCFAAETPQDGGWVRLCTSVPRPGPLARRAAPWAGGGGGGTLGPDWSVCVMWRTLMFMKLDVVCERVMPITAQGREIQSRAGRIWYMHPNPRAFGPGWRPSGTGRAEMSRMQASQVRCGTGAVLLT